MKEHLIKTRTPDGIWLTGSIDGHNFEAKVSDEESKFGIDGGRVIKLHMDGKRENLEVISYERGWQRYPHASEYKELLIALLRFCAELPKQEVWRKTQKRDVLYLVTEDEVLEYEHYQLEGSANDSNSEKGGLL